MLYHLFQFGPDFFRTKLDCPPQNAGNMSLTELLIIFIMNKRIAMRQLLQTISYFIVRGNGLDGGGAKPPVM